MDAGSNKCNKRERGGGINSMEWIDREEWRRKIKLNLCTERCDNIDTEHVNKIIIIIINKI